MGDSNWPEKKFTEERLNGCPKLCDTLIAPIDTGTAVKMNRATMRAMTTLLVALSSSNVTAIRFVLSFA
jgi:hypothetical protein